MKQGSLFHYKREKMLAYLRGYDERTLKNNIRSALIRIRLQVTKQTNATKVSKREVAVLIGDGKKEMARIKCEHIIRVDNMIEAYGILELFLELISARVHMVTSSKKNQPPCQDMFECVTGIVFGAKRVTLIEELTKVATHLGYKYGTAYIDAAEQNVGGIVNERLFKKVTLTPITEKLLWGYMTEISKTYNVEYDEEEPKDESVSAGLPVGRDVPQAPASNLTGVYAPVVVQQQSLPDPPSIDNMNHPGTRPSESTPESEESYDGERNEMGQKHGKGTLRYTDGMYVGQYFKDMRHGHGTMTYNDKSMYIGDWWEDKRQGRGKLIGHAGTLFFDGEWWHGHVQDERSRRELDRELTRIANHMRSQSLPAPITQVPQVAIPVDLINDNDNQQSITPSSSGAIPAAEAFYTDEYPPPPVYKTDNSLDIAGVNEDLTGLKTELSEMSEDNEVYPPSATLPTPAAPAPIPVAKSPAPAPAAQAAAEANSIAALQARLAALRQ
jgi:hypothetical protein